MAKNLQLPFAAWAIYRMRFIFTADICGDWASFGGLAAQLNGLSVVLNIAATDNIQTALINASLLPNHLGELSRPRAESTAGATDFSSLLATEQLHFKTQAASHADGAASKGGKPIEEVPNGKKKKQKQPWAPRKEYLDQLGRDRPTQAPPARSRKRSRSRRIFP